MMKYKLYTDETYSSPREQILRARGIENIDEWINANKHDINDWKLLDCSYSAAQEIDKTMICNEDMLIVVDCDVDGYTSAAILINYLYKLNPDYVKNHLSYIHHHGKEHGLADIIDDIDDNISLVICPDSASNDYEYHEILSNNGQTLLIMDHHEAPEVSMLNSVITVNNQLCDYPNKSFSGAGVVWQVCKAIDHYLDVNIADEFIDLCALGNCGDMMDYRNIETRAVVKEGFKNIKNPFLYQMIQDNDYIIQKHGGLNYRAMAFAVVPFINATVRSGTMEEKDLIFKAMCLPWCYDQVPFTKRGHKGEFVPRYVEAAYKTAAIKRRQTKLENESLALVDRKIKENNLLDNSVIIVQCEPGEVEKNIAGLVANKLQAKYQRPSMVLTKSKTKDDDEYFYRGSMRNYSMSEVENFKDVLEETGLTEFVAGHQGAAGVGIAANKMEEITNKLNEFYGEVSKEPIYWVDYIWRAADVEDSSLLELANMKEFWGQEIPPAQVCIENINLSQCRLSLCGKSNDTLRMILPNGVVLVYFGISEMMFDQMLEEDMYMTCIVSPAKNEWMGKVSGEGMIDDFIVEQKWVF